MPSPDADSASTEASQPVAPHSAVEARALERLRAIGGDELLVELIDLTLEDTPRRLGEMREACDRGDLEKVGFVAHTLKSWCGQLGAGRMLELCQRLETSRDGARVGESSNLVGELEREFELMRSELLRVREGR